MKMRCLRPFAVILFLLASTAFAQGGNTNYCNSSFSTEFALPLFVSGGPFGIFNDGEDHIACTFVLGNTVAGRSYSFIAEIRSPLQNRVVVKKTDGTLIASETSTSSQQAAGEPLHANWIATAANAGINYVEVGPWSGEQYVRLVETTVWCPWWFTAGDYNSYSLVENTSGVNINSRWIWRDLTGAQVATVDILIPDRSWPTIVSARDFVPAGVVSGSVEIAHDGPPGSLVGSTTTLSGTTGLSFDSRFSARPVY